MIVIITCFGALLRFYKLGIVPDGFHRDEAFLGYNAYSLLKTGKDMSGKLLPLHFESFIYSPGGYSYASIPFIAIFGLDEFSTRFASAFFGTLTIPLLFLLAYKLFPKTPRIGILGSFILVITPWHINLSRTATENILVTFFLLLGIYFFFVWKDHQNKLLFLLLGFISISLTLVIYQAPRAFLPMFIPFMFSILFFDKKRSIFLPLVLYSIFILLPVGLVLSNSHLSTRMKTVSIWSTEKTSLIIQEQIREDGVRNIHPLVSRITHNKIIGYTEEFLRNYFLHFSYDFLFADRGMPDRYRIPHAGLLYISMIPLVLSGIYYLMTEKKRIGWFLIGWISIGIIGSALTFDDIPNLQRTVFIVPAVSLIISVGTYSLLGIRSNILRIATTGIFLFAFFFEGYRYLHHYYVQQIVHRPWYRQEGYRELVQFIQKIEHKYNNIVITNRESAPTIFFLFYTKYDPKQFQEETKYSTFRDFDRISFYKYIFSEEECPLKEVSYQSEKNPNIIVTNCYGEKNSLYVNSGLCKEPKVCANILRTVRRNDGTNAFFILEPTGVTSTSTSLQ